MRREKVYDINGNQIKYDETKQMYKECTNCNSFKPIDQFYKLSKKRLCIQCIKEYNKEIYQENKNEYKLKYYKYQKKNINKEYGQDKVKEANC